MAAVKTWRAPEELHERLREVAFRSRRSANVIITEAVEEWLDRHEGSLSEKRSISS